jgi:hypothetical protein
VAVITNVDTDFCIASLKYRIAQIARLEKEFFPEA